MPTPYHAKYYAHELTKIAPPNDVDRLSMSLFDACVDLNPHQIEAALFALRSPTAKGVLLADEVGLGKTIEASLVLCQCWAERKRRLLVICPASIRKQWSLELLEKFNLPNVVLDAREYRLAENSAKASPFLAEGVVIVSMHFANKMKEAIRTVPWDLVVLDEAHKLRGAYRPSNKIGQAVRWAIGDRRKILLTATPLQNSLIELYGLSTFIDDLIFGDAASFRTQYMSAQGDLQELRARLAPFCTRTLRHQVAEYVNFTSRHALTRPFKPTDEEHKLYDAVSEFLLRPDTYAIPHRQRQLTTLIIRKLLASSSRALAGTLETMKARLETVRAGLSSETNLVESIINEEEMEQDLLDEEALSNDENEKQLDGKDDNQQAESQPIDRRKLDLEIMELGQYAAWARSIGVDTKTRALISALEIGFLKMEAVGAKKKALIFTESRRTQEYVKSFLEANGYAGKVITFNGSNSDSEAKAIYDRWLATNVQTGRASGSRSIDIRTALIEHFAADAEVMIATEAAAEGVNLQFCSLLINYDLPWNPQRIEQRIGRCHRYGQKHDVVVINFLNERNYADQRVLELLEEKFNLFDGVFGASDEVLGAIESGVDFEKRILEIYQKCRTQDEIADAFQLLQKEMEETISLRMEETRSKLLENFDEDVHARLKMQLDQTKVQLDRFTRSFWTLTKFILAGAADFDELGLTFLLNQPVCPDIRTGRYHLISKQRENVTGDFLYRLSHPLGEHVVAQGKTASTPMAQVVFDVTGYPTKLTVVDELKGKQGWLILQRLIIDSFQREEYLLFSALDDSGRTIDHEVCQKMFLCTGSVALAQLPSSEMQEKLLQNGKQHVRATISRSMEKNNVFFQDERERLDKWADDMVLAADKDLQDTKAKIRAMNRQARHAVTIEEQHQYQTKVQELEKIKRRQRQRIFDVEDEISAKRDKLVDALEKRMAHKTTVEPLFSIQWKVI